MSGSEEASQHSQDEGNHSDRRSRKSVTFTEEQVVVNSDGTVVIMDAAIDENKKTAESHRPRTASLTAALSAFADPSQAPAEPPTAVADDGGLDLSLMKKKKKSSKKKVEDEADATDDAPATEAGEGAGDDTLNLGAKKKKKKKVVDDDFAARLKAVDLNTKDGDDANESADDVQEGDMHKGTGLWSHEETRPISYDLLLTRFFDLLSQKNPDHASSGSKSYKIPPPQCLREGNKKTIFANIAEICKRMNRSDEHVTAYLFAELGTSGSVDGNRRLVIKGRFQGKQIENVLRKYIVEYVACKTCFGRSPNTELSKGENRLYFITCNSCGSRRTVQAIKTGFSAQVGKRRKMQG